MAKRVVLPIEVELSTEVHLVQPSHRFGGLLPKNVDVLFLGQELAVLA
jgi:hypothetical protein